MTREADHTTQAALTQLAQAPSPTGVPFTLVHLGERISWQAHTIAGELACDAGEYLMRPRTRKPNRRSTVPALALLGLAGYLTARKAGGR